MFLHSQLLTCMWYCVDINIMTVNLRFYIVVYNIILYSLCGAIIIIIIIVMNYL